MSLNRPLTPRTNTVLGGFPAHGESLFPNFHKKMPPDSSSAPSDLRNPRHPRKVGIVSERRVNSLIYLPVQQPLRVFGKESTLSRSLT